MNYAIPLWDAPCVPIAGSADVFPVRHVYCVGRNYAEHAKEMGGDATKEPPFFFCKPADAVFPVVPPAVGSVRYPLATKNFHHEIELVVAIGKRGVQLRAEDANALVFGYATGLDMTRRDLQNDMREKKRPWDLGKSFAQAAPIAPIHPVAADRAARPRRDHARRERRAAPAGRPGRHDLGRAAHARVPFAVLRAAAGRPRVHRHARRRRRGGRRRPAGRTHRRPDAAVDCRSHERSRDLVLTPEFVERGYNNRAAVAEHPLWLDEVSGALRGDARAPSAHAGPALRAGPAADARPVPAGERRARNVRVHPRRLLARRSTSPTSISWPGRCWRRDSPSPSPTTTFARPYPLPGSSTNAAG